MKNRRRISYHDMLVAGHGRRWKMIELVTGIFFLKSTIYYTGHSGSPYLLKSQMMDLVSIYFLFNLFLIFELRIRI